CPALPLPPSFPTRRSSDLCRICLCILHHCFYIRIIQWTKEGLQIKHFRDKPGLPDCDLFRGVVVFPADASHRTRRCSISFIHLRSEEHTSELQSRFDLVCR